MPKVQAPSISREAFIMLVLVIAMLLKKDEQVHGLEQRPQAAKCGVSGSLQTQIITSPPR